MPFRAVTPSERAARKRRSADANRDAGEIPATKPNTIRRKQDGRILDPPLLCPRGAGTQYVSPVLRPTSVRVPGLVPGSSAVSVSTVRPLPVPGSVPRL